MATKYSIYGIVIQCFLFSVMLAYDGSAQNIQSVRETYIELDLKNANLLEVFRSIEASTEYVFAYDKNDIHPDIRINLNMNRVSVADALLELSKKAD